MIRVHLRQAMTSYEVNEGKRLNYGSLASMTGLAESTIAALASDQSNYNPTLEVINKLCIALKCDMDELLTYRPPILRPQEPVKTSNEISITQHSEHQNMKIQISVKTATRLLHNAVKDAKSSKPKEPWSTGIRDICEAAETKSKTTIAVLGTIILAKATNIDVDPLLLKSGAGEGGYSARSLGQHVLAANRITLKLDIGTKGKEPFNNQPYFAKNNLNEAHDAAHTKAEKALSLLVDFAEELKLVTDGNEAYEILVEYCRIRSSESTNVDIDVSNEPFDLQKICNDLESFLYSNSEGGKRAQACIAALFDAQYGPKRVNVSSINDPDRRFPGDIVIMHSSMDKIYIAYEVRDKDVKDSDLMLFVEKVADADIKRVGIIGLSANQTAFTPDGAVKYAQERGVLLDQHFSMLSILGQTTFLSELTPNNLYKQIMTYLIERSIEMDVSKEGLQELERLLS